MFLLLPLTQVFTAEVWTEDFEIGPFDEWYLRGYELIDNTAYQTDVAPTITNGMLQMPLINRFDWNASQALRNSTLAYGSWSFDLYVTPGLDHTPYCAFWPISNIALNLSGLALDDPYLNAYYVLFGEFNADGTPHIDFWEITSGVENRFRKYDFMTPFAGSYHVEITRALDGNWRIYFDDIFLFSVVDNTTTTSERITISNRFGDPAFDNITLMDSFTDTHTPTISTTTDGTSGFTLLFLCFSMIAFCMWRRKR